MITVTKTYLPAIGAYVSCLEKIWQTGQITNNGPLSRQLSTDLEKYLGVSNLEIVANGTLALQLAIKALGLQGRSLPRHTVMSPQRMRSCGKAARRSLSILRPKTFCINPDLIETAITEKTSAILATHVYGYPCDVVKIKRIADKYNLKVIYDAAHAFGVKLIRQVYLACTGIAAL